MSATERACPPAGLERDVPLSRTTSARVGGPADYFVVAKSSEELERAARWGISEGLDLLVLGAGSNVVVADRGFRGLVIKSISRGVRVLGEDEEGVVVELDSGTFLPSAAKTLARLGVTGLEWGVGIPGTAGGAVVGNAGAYGGEIRDTLLEIDALDSRGGTVTLANEDLGFVYRGSAIKRGEADVSAILRVRHRLSRGDLAAAEARTRELLSERRRKEPVEPSVGSTFKNPEGTTAGILIESLGLKGLRVGRAMVSPKHANYMINTGGATAAEVRELIELVQRTVFERSGVLLETEIEFKGEW